MEVVYSSFLLIIISVLFSLFFFQFLDSPSQKITMHDFLQEVTLSRIFTSTSSLCFCVLIVYVCFIFLCVCEGPRWQSGNTLASHLWGRGSIPVMALSGEAGSCLALVGSLQYTTLANSMYWFPLPFQLPVMIWPVQCWKQRKTPNK